MTSGTVGMMPAIISSSAGAVRVGEKRQAMS